MPAQPTPREQQTLQTWKTFTDRVRNSRAEVLRNKYENVLFYDGHQWLAPLPDGRGFMRANLRRDVPRPVTNRYKAIIDAIDAPLSRLEPAMSCEPSTGKDIDRLTASLGNKVVDYLYELCEVDRYKGEVSKILSICNDAYGHVGFDPDAGETTSVPQWECKACDRHLSADAAEGAGGMCPQCRSPLKPSKQTDDLANGQVFLEAVTPFEMWVDYAIPRIEDQPIIMIRRMRTKTWAETHYPQYAKQVAELPNANTADDVGLTYLQSIIRLAPGAGTGTIGFGAAMRWDEAIIDDTLYAMPSKDYPRGLFLRVLGGQLVVEDRELAALCNTGSPAKPQKPFIPIIHYGYDNIPGCHQHTGPADQLKDLQRQRNRREAAIELYFARMANGVWLIPEGTDVQTPTGEEGWVMRYSPLGGNGAKPERVEGNRLPSSFVEWLTMIDKQMEDVAGTYDIFRGEKPPNVSSGYAMQILTERAQSRFAHLFANYEVAHATLGKYLFLRFRWFAPDEIYFRIKGEEARWTVETIKSADLEGGINFKVEAGSARPRTSLEKKAAIEQALSLQLIDLADPDVRLKILHVYGIPELMASAQADDEHIAREHETLIAWARSVTNPETGLPIDGLSPEQLAMPVLVDPLLDNHPLHLQRHRPWMLSDEFRALPDWIRGAFRDGHYVEHLYEAQMDAMQQAAQGAPGAPAGGSPQQSGPGGQSGSGGNAGAARAQGQAQAMQAGGKPPGPGAESGNAVAEGART